MNEAAEIKLRAERMAGAALAEMQKAKPGPSPKIGNVDAPISEVPTLAEIGVTKRQSSDWQAEASVPEPVPNARSVDGRYLMRTTVLATYRPASHHPAPASSTSTARTART